MNGTNRWFLIAGVGLLIAALVFLNQGIKKDSPTDEDLQQQAQQAQTEAQKARPNMPAPPKPGSAAAALPADEAVGDPAKAQHHLLVGWSYDEANQANPDSLTGPLQAIRDYVRKSGGSVSAEIVNLDVPVADRTTTAKTVTAPGIMVDGKPALPGQISAMHVTAPDITKALDAAIGKK